MRSASCWLGALRRAVRHRSVYPPVSAVMLCELCPRTRERRNQMTRMSAAEAAVQVLRREGVNTAFGLPGAAINPFYAAMRLVGGIDHVLARHVEAASHMAEGYTRAKAGNIGVCIGTSGPAGTR